MIQVPNSSPKTVSFVQKGSADPVLAATQIAKASRDEVVARGELENTSFRLQKATEYLKATEIAYFEAVAKNAWNSTELKKAYNNALAGFREADKAHEAAGEMFTKASEILGGLRDFAKGESTPQITKSAPAAKGIEMKFAKEAVLVMCPLCFGDGDSSCPCCSGLNDGLVHESQMGRFPAQAEDTYYDEDEDFSKSFSTSSLLTRDFQKSAGFQSYINVTKYGVKGRSGRHKGDGGGRANQHTGELVNTREKTPEGKTVRVGWKTRNKNYGAGYEANFKAGREALRSADKLRSEADKTKSKDTYAQAAEKYDEASKLLMLAQGHAHGFGGTHLEWAAKGHKDADAALGEQWKEKAADARNMAYGAKHLAGVCREKAGISAEAATSPTRGETSRVMGDTGFMSA